MEEIKINELRMDTLEQVTGGVTRYINTGSTSKAQIRSGPTTAGSNRQDTLVNGTAIHTIDDSLVWDEASGRHFVQISYVNKNGQQRTGWIASSIVGLPR